MKEKQLIVTFDYELFLGKNSGSVEKCLIIPTEKISAVLNKFNVKAIFFIDTTYLLRLKEKSFDHLNAFNDFNKIKKQLSVLASQGHLLYHHFHPHWLDAIYDPITNIWDCSNHQRFALSNLGSNEIESIVAFSDTFIRELYPKKDVPEYLGFRAGGLYSQPFHLFAPIFKKYNIKYDFSVLKGAKSFGKSFCFDYSNMDPTIELIYTFENSNIEEVEDGFFIEVSLINFEMNLLQRIINSIFYRMFSRKNSWKRFGDGTSSGNIIHSDQNKSQLNGETFSIELLNFVKCLYYFNYLSKNQQMHLINHPKLLSENSIKSFERFLFILRKKYFIQSNFNELLVRMNSN